MLWSIAEVYYRCGRGRLGMGDVKMLAMIGAFLGWKLTLVTLMMASLPDRSSAWCSSRAGAVKCTQAAVRDVSRAGRGAAATVGPELLNWYLGFW